MASTSSEGGGLKAEGGGGLAGTGDGTVADAVGVEKTVCNVGDEKSQQSSSSGSLVTLRASGALMKKARRERAGSTAKERISKMPPCTAGKRSSIYRGVTRHRWTGRYEAHLWDKTTWNQNQNKKGKQVYLGAYDDEEAAARAYDLAALKYWGPGTLINFPVTDYSRDLEEMQNVSREEYLASLRRKSSGFSRGISKFRSLSSRWEPSLGRAAGHEYFQGMQYGDDATPESGFASRVCIERKIDLTGYIKWWVPKKGRSLDSKPSEGSKLGIAEDVSRELKSLERSVLSTQPYQMPHLGTSHEGKKKKGPAVSALSILSKSPAYKNMQERVSKIKDIQENDENENKSNINKIDYGKAVEKSSDHDGEHDRLGVPFEMGGSLLHKSMFPLSPLLSAPLLTSYSAIDPLPDPILWSSLVSGVPSGPPLTAEVTKAEASSTYGFFRQQDET